MKILSKNIKAFAAMVALAFGLSFAPQALSAMQGQQVDFAPIVAPSVVPSAQPLQDVQVAHGCWIGRVHVGGEHERVGFLGEAHTRGAQCAKKGWINYCLKRNSPLDTSRGGDTCLDPCPQGWIVDESNDWKNVDTCVKCPNGTMSQPNNLCVAISELEDWCRSKYQSYNSDSNRCVEIGPVNEWCLSVKGVPYNFEANECKACPSGTMTQPGGRCVEIEELVEHCRNHSEHPYNVEANECAPCPEGTASQSGGRCVPFAELEAWCASHTDGKVYSPEANDCVAPSANSTN